MPLYRRVEPNTQLLEFRCNEFVEELTYGNLRKTPLVKHWEGDTMTISGTVDDRGQASDIPIRELSRRGDLALVLTSTRGKEKNMRTKLALMIGIAGLAVAGWSAAAWAHHAFAAEFDADKPVTFKGTITKMEWVNPHTWLHVDVKNPDGMVVNWAIEAGTPNVLFRRGFTKDSLLPGTEIVVDGYQSKDGSRRANGRDLTFPDGRKLFLGSSGTGAPYELTPGSQKTN